MKSPNVSKRLTFHCGRPWPTPTKDVKSSGTIRASVSPAMVLVTHLGSAPNILSTLVAV